MKLLIFDTETTSIKPGSICQLSYIIIDTGTKPQKTWGKNYFFAVDEMDAGAQAVHGFSMEKLYELSGGMYFEDLFEEFLSDFQSADFIIGHNVNFDIKFLKHELEVTGEEFSPKRIFDTMHHYINICRIPKANGDIKNPKLEEVVKFLGITDEMIKSKSEELFEGSGNYHDARFDTTATYLLVTEGLKKKYIKPGYFSQQV